MPDESTIAAILYTVRESCQTPEDLTETLKRLGGIGYRNVQISGIGKIEPEEVKAALDASGMNAIGHHVPIKHLRKKADAVLERLKLWGCRHVALAILGEEERATEADWLARAKELNEIGAAFAREGVTLQYHNHSFEFECFGRGADGTGGRTGLALLYENTDPAALQAELDTHWIARGGGDPASWCRSMAGRMDQVHLKDFAVIDNKPVFAEIGEGNLNWPAILDACREAGVKHYIVEQDDCPVTNDPFRSLEISLRNLNAMGIH